MRYAPITFSASLMGVLCLSAGPQNKLPTVVVAPPLRAAEGNTVSSSPLADTGAAFLQTIPASGLAGLRPGDHITGIAFRLDNSAPPNPALSSPRYEIYLGVGAAAKTLRFSDYYVPQTRKRVRTGPLSFPAGAFTASRQGKTPEALGPTIAFTNDYVYTGGPLVYEIRCAGFSGPIFLDADDSPAANGYNGLTLLGEDADTATVAFSQRTNFVQVTGLEVRRTAPPAR